MRGAFREDSARAKIRLHLSTGFGHPEMLVGANGGRLLEYDFSIEHSSDVSQDGVVHGSG